METTLRAALFGCLLIFVSPLPGWSAEFRTGVVLDHVFEAGVAEQNAVIEQLKSAGVHMVRVGGLAPDDKSIDFLKRLSAQSIQVELLVGPKFRSDAPTRPFQAKEFPGMWSGHPLSSADPELSKEYFKALIGKLDAGGIALAGLELGNEYNWAPFNAEFPLPGEGRNFGLDDLYHDPEAQQIAKGFLQYLKILEALKDVRDHSSVNRHTPLISVGLADDGPVGPWHNSRVSGVNLNATIQFLRANGLDRIVDFYGIHTYPNNRISSAERKAKIEENALTECHSAGSAVGKPCWITEWGIKTDDLSCPANDSKRVPIVRDVLNDFRQYARDGRLVGAIYFPWSSTSDPKSLYRCGGLTESGQIILAPMQVN